MTDKTPEEQAEEHCKGLELAQGFDSSKFTWPPAYFTKEELREAWLVGYAAALPKWKDIAVDVPELDQSILVWAFNEAPNEVAEGCEIGFYQLWKWSEYSHIDAHIRFKYWQPLPTKET